MQEDQKPARTEKEKSRDQRFVETVMERCRQDKGMAARLRRADNLVWPHFCRHLGLTVRRIDAGSKTS